MKILIVEDDPSVCQVLHILCAEYWRVEKCEYVHNIEEAIKTLNSFRPDVILLDFLLEGELAFPVVNFVRDKYFYDPPRIIAMSALNQGAELAAIHDVSEFIRKPFNIEMLEQLIFKK